MDPSAPSPDAAPADQPADQPTDRVVFFWRPGCGFCSGLRRQLDRRGVRYVAVNIWDDPDAASFVRSVARGNETVPTVAIGPIALVNPSVLAVIDACSEHAPDALGDPDEHDQP